MYLIFEEDGAFKTATIMADNDTSLQVETASGKRAKIKSGNVLLRYSSPAPGELLGSAEALALWISKRTFGSVQVMASFLFVILPTTTSATKPAGRSDCVAVSSFSTRSLPSQGQRALP